MLRFGMLCCVCVSLASLAAFETAQADELFMRGSIDAADAVVVKPARASAMAKNSNRVPEFLLRASKKDAVPEKSDRKAVAKVSPKKSEKTIAKAVVKAPVMVHAKPLTKITKAPVLVAKAGPVVKKPEAEKIIAIETVVAPRVPSTQKAAIANKIQIIPAGNDQPDDLYTASILPVVVDDIYTASLASVVGPRVKSERQPLSVLSLYELGNDDLKSIVESGVPNVEKGAPVSNLAEAVKGAREKAPSILASEAEAEAANAAIDNALAAYVPTVTGTLEANRANVEDITGPNNFGSISASLPLYTGGQRTAKVKGAIATAQSAESNVDVAKSRVTAQVVSAYVNYSVSGDLIDVIKASETATLDILKSVKVQQAAGFVSAADVAQVEFELAGVRQQIAEIEAERLKARERVISLSGKPVAGNIKIADLRRGMAPGREALLRRASNENPQIMVAEKNYEAARHSVRANYGRSLPQLSVQSNYRHDLDGRLENNGRDDWNVGARLTVPFLDLATMTDNKRSSLQAKATYYRAIEVKRQVQDDFNQLWSDYISASRQLENADAKIAARKRIAESAKARFREGAGSLTEVLVAQRDVNAARIERQQLEGLIVSTMAQILVASGSFDGAVLGH